MIEILRKMSIGSRRHVDEEELLRLADGELSAWHSRRVQRHLERCWTCRSRYEQVQGAILDFVEYRNRIVLPHLPLPKSTRDRFLRKIDELGRETMEPRLARVAYVLRSAIAPMTNPVLATFFIAIASVAAIFVVWQRSVPSVSASELLDRAQVWDTDRASPVSPGVIYQKIEIRTPTVTFDRSLYRDIEGRRRMRRGGTSLQQAALQRAVTSGGVDWQRPLSASDFRKWNDHLPDKKDEVFSNRNGTLTLRTRTNASEVQEESLTVRRADFHPVARHLVLRDLGEVDIAELSYEVLPWNAVDVAQLFESDALALPVVPSAMRRPAPTAPSAATLDEAELRARLALNEIGADTGENISVERNSDSVKIAGFVETQLRKREIDHAVVGLPFVSTSVSTFEVRNQQLAGPEEPQPTNIREENVVAQGSPLEMYLAAHSVPPQQALQLSRDLLDEALEIDRQALALNALEKRFPPVAWNSLTTENAALLRQLIGRHISVMQAAIQREWELIRAYAGEPTAAGLPLTAEVPTAADLLRFANENRRLSGELLGAQNEGQRSGDLILAELAESLQQCERISKNFGHDAN